MTANATQVDFIKSDFRCFVGLEEYDDHLVKSLVYPNPVDDIITIKASGLICGRDYKMDIVDLSGKTWYAQTIQAKMSLEIPLESLPAGVYIFRIHAKKGFVTERVVKG